MRGVLPNDETVRVNLNDAYVISDTHFLHANIVEYEPSRKELGVDHNRAMIRRWQDTVPDDGIVLHVGDLTLGQAPHFALIAEQLPGRKILVKGNHDSRSNTWYSNHGFQVVPRFYIEHDDWIIRVSHEPGIPPIDKDMLVLHGHVHSKSLEDRRFINVSAEVIDFTPQPLRKLLDDRIEELCLSRSSPDQVTDQAVNSGSGQSVSA